MAVLSLCCCTGFSQVVNAEAGYSAVAVQRLLIVVASLVVEHGLSGRGARAQWLWSTGSVVVEHGLSCPVASGIFSDRGLNWCLLLWQADA